MLFNFAMIPVDRMCVDLGELVYAVHCNSKVFSCRFSKWARYKINKGQKQKSHKKFSNGLLQVVEHFCDLLGIYYDK